MNQPAKQNRHVVVKTTLHEQDDDGYIANATPAERMLMVWPMTLSAWKFFDPSAVQAGFQKHVVRIQRGKGS